MSDTIPSLETLLKTMVKHNASDLLLCIGSAPQLRLDGSLTPMNTPKLTLSDLNLILKNIYHMEGSGTKEELFKTCGEIDLAIGIPGVSRFRINIYKQRGVPSIAARRIPYEILTVKELGLPEIVENFCNKPNGLVLVTGATGSGKSTTLASIIDKINEEKHKHIITIEDPIEFLHNHKNSLVDQREIGSDTNNYKDALKYILRQDPDVVLIGEMRDKETIEAALTIAETGHLVFATLHTNSAAQTITRIVDVFPAEQQNQVRTQLSLALIGILSQQLVPKIGGGRSLAMEIMVATNAISSMIRENKVHQMDNQIAIGTQFGMLTMNQSLSLLVRSGIVDRNEAFLKSSDVADLQDKIDNII